MFRVSLTVLVFAYLFFFLTVVFGIWIWYELKRQMRERRAVRHRVRCGMCAYQFDDLTTDPLPRCPSCAARNERRPVSLL